MRTLPALVLLLGLGSSQAAEWRAVDGAPPPLELPDLDGRSHALDDYRGQVVLVNFWGSWCPPCVEEMPALQRLADALAGQPFRILAVNVGESRGKVAPFVKRLGLSLTVLLDRNNRAGKAWGVRVFPTTYLLDAQGRLRARVLGEEAWDEEAVIARVRALLPPRVAGAAP